MGSRRSRATVPFFMEQPILRVDAGPAKVASESSVIVSKPSPSRLGSQRPAGAYRCDRSQLLVPLKISRSVMLVNPFIRHTFCHNPAHYRGPRQQPSALRGPLRRHPSHRTANDFPLRETPGGYHRRARTPFLGAANAVCDPDPLRNRHQIAVFAPAKPLGPVVTMFDAIFMGQSGGSCDRGLYPATSMVECAPNP